MSRGLGDVYKRQIFDSYFDSYRGVVILVRIVSGKITKKTKIKMLTTGAEYDVVSLGYHTPFEHEVEELKEGEVGFITASIKSLSSVSVGDTITDANDPTDKALPGYKPMKPMVYCGIYPIESNKYPALKEAIEKLKLNDASLTFEPESSSTLGFGFRMGFLGLLHLEIISERIEREFNLETIATTPSVVYKVGLTSGEEIDVSSPCLLYTSPSPRDTR